MKRIWPFVTVVVFLMLWMPFGISASDNSSQALVMKASECLQNEDWQGVMKYTRKCISLYQSEARKMQRRLKDFPPMETATDYWALNDVAYAYFLQAEMYRLREQYEKAKSKYEKIIKTFGFAQVYDPAAGGDWKVAEAARQKLKKIRPFLPDNKKSHFIKKKLKLLK